MSVASGTTRMHPALAWAILASASAAIPAMLAAPFVPDVVRVPVGMAAGSSILALSLLVGAARAGRRGNVRRSRPRAGEPG